VAVEGNREWQTGRRVPDGNRNEVDDREYGIPGTTDARTRSVPHFRAGDDQKVSVEGTLKRLGRTPFRTWIHDILRQV
jgi:hypothetical protein